MTLTDGVGRSCDGEDAAGSMRLHVGGQFVYVLCKVYVVKAGGPSVHTFPVLFPK